MLVAYYKMHIIRLWIKFSWCGKLHFSWNILENKVTQYSQVHLVLHKLFPQNLLVLAP